MARAVLENLRLTNPGQVNCHAGLWLDKMPPPSETLNSQVIAPHVRSLENLPIPYGYKHAFERRKRAFEVLVTQNRALIFEAKSLGRSAVGLGAKTALEFGLTLDHTWGVPYLPGSALKGLAAATAHQILEDPDWHKPLLWPEAKAEGAPSSYQTLFGATDQAGLVTFHDAWWIPTHDVCPFYPDVMTVHHPDYYQKEGKNQQPPTDLDEPVPVPFLSVSGDFLLVLESDNPEWLYAAKEIITKGLSDLGIGAKTSSGYGRFSLTELQTEGQKAVKERISSLQNAIRTHQGAQTRSSIVDALKKLVLAGDSLDVAKTELQKLEKRDLAATIEALRRQLPEDKYSTADSLVVKVAQADSPPKEEPRAAKTEQAEVWLTAKAWAVLSKKNKLEVFVEGFEAVDIGKVTNKSPETEALKEKLQKANKSQPTDVHIQVDEKKRLKKIRG